MRTSKRLVAMFISVCLLLVAAPVVRAADADPDALVKSTVDEVLAVIKQNKDRQWLRALAEQKVVPHFDFRRMTQLAVGPSWRQANPAQQQALENSFRTLLVNTYTNALSVAATGRQILEVKPVQVKPDQHEITVKTTVKDPGKQPLAIDYRMAREADGWKVFDVVVEDLSLVTNYRGTFASEVSRSGIDGLIKALDDKNRTLARS